MVSSGPNMLGAIRDYEMQHTKEIGALSASLGSLIFRGVDFVNIPLRAFWPFWKISGTITYIGIWNNFKLDNPLLMKKSPSGFQILRQILAFEKIFKSILIGEDFDHNIFRVRGRVISPPLGISPTQVAYWGAHLRPLAYSFSLTLLMRSCFASLSSFLIAISGNTISYCLKRCLFSIPSTSLLVRYP